MTLPGSARTHLWTGLIFALVGVLVGGYAYTGDRIYDITYLPIAVVGLLFVLGGSALAGYGQANRPRLGGRADEDEDDPSLVDRLRAWVAEVLGDDGDDTEGQPEATEDEADAQAS